MQRIRSLIIEMHRRSLWQVLGVYLFGSWAIYEIIAEVTTRMGLPDWVPGFAIVLFLIGLPIVIATAIVQEGLPGQSVFDRPEEVGPADPTLVPGLDPQPAERRAGGTALLTPARPHAFLTWQRSVLAGLVAFLMLGLTAGGYIGLRNAGVPGFASLITSGAMDARDRIIIAQLEHASGDTVTAAAVTEALRVDLAQSPVVTVLESRFLGDALQRMGRPRDARLTGALAREVAIREGAKAVLEGEITPAGSGSIITARLLHAGTGELLISHRETADGEADVIPAIDRMSRKLRERIGESLRTVRADAPLEAVTTASLRALELYTQGTHALDMERDYDRGIRLLQEAVAEDSTFAMAWRKLAVGYNNARAGRDRLAHATRMAYEHRDRLTERERYHTIALYHLNVGPDNTAAINAYRTLLDTYPDDHTALNNIALAYGRIRDQDRAAEYYHRAIAVDSFVPSSWTNLALTEYYRGNTAEARSLLDAASERFPDQRDNRAFAAGLAQAEGNYEEAERILRQLVDDSRDSDVWRARSTFTLAGLTQMLGRLGEARRLYEESLAANRARGISQAGLWHEGTLAGLDAWVLQKPEAALRRLDGILASDLWRETPPATRGYLEVAQGYAATGQPAKARRLIAEWQDLPESDRGDGNWILPTALGWIAMAENRPADAVQRFREAADYGSCDFCGLATLASAFRVAEMPDSAILYYRRYIDATAMDRITDDAWELAPAYESLAELYEAAGDLEAARNYAGLFIALWKDADPELQPRVRRKRDLLERLVER
ncbi:MAG TPA: tetratricopeptide repeat protein [Longimicrobiales bacterium]|nr:tetratricopeptide repeat protein [Longimicrobiales bacterium]